MLYIRTVLEELSDFKYSDCKVTFNYNQDMDSKLAQFQNTGGIISKL